MFLSTEESEKRFNEIYKTQKAVVDRSFAGKKHIAKKMIELELAELVAILPPLYKTSKENETNDFLTESDSLKFGTNKYDYSNFDNLIFIYDKDKVKFFGLNPTGLSHRGWIMENYKDRNIFNPLTREKEHPDFLIELYKKGYQMIAIETFWFENYPRDLFNSNAKKKATLKKIEEWK